jgi:hypothetical protein
MAFVYDLIAIKQDGKVVSIVKPNTSIQLYADLDWWPILTFSTEYLVEDMDTGQIVLQQSAGINVITGLSYYNWTSPAKAGNYRFYPDSSDINSYADFSVTNTGVENGSLFTPKNILILAGAALAALLLSGRD